MGILQNSLGAREDEVDSLKKSLEEYMNEKRNLSNQIAFLDKGIRERDEKMAEIDADYRIIKESSEVKISALMQQIKYQEVTCRKYGELYYSLACNTLIYALITNTISGYTATAIAPNGRSPH